MKAAVLEQLNAPLGLGHVECPARLEYGQVLVKVLVSGICGAQLQEIDGIKGDPKHLPHLLGHEGCGIVQGVGEGVTTVQVGDKVVMHWRKGAGIEATPAIYSGGVKAGPITTFSEYAVVSENRVTKVPYDTPNDFAALLGCALSTALAIIENEAQPKFGESLLVVGCGGVGLSIIFVARALSRSNIWATDISPLKKELVENLGAVFLYKTIYFRSDIVIDTVGVSESKNLVSRLGKHISLQAGGTSAGGFEPVWDIPRYIQLWQDGRLNGYEKLITHRISLDQINEGIQLMRDGKAGRVMIEMNR